MKIFKTILSTILLLCLASCEGSSYNARQNVETEFPNSIIYNVPDRDYVFIVLDSIGRIWYVKCLNLNNDNISSKTLIHNAQ